MNQPKNPSRDDDKSAASPWDEHRLREAIADARAGSNDALDGLLGECRKYLLELANRQIESGLGAKLGASDVVQDTLLDATRGLKDFRGQTKGELLAWLKQIFNHNMLDVRRRYFEAEKRRVAREQPIQDGSRLLHDPAASTDTPSAALGQDEDSRRLQQALSQLPPEYRRAVELRNWQLKSFREIGEELHRSEEAARKLWTRAIEKLQSALAESDGDT